MVADDDRILPNMADDKTVTETLWIDTNVKEN
jgi:hypothetical protein